MLITCIRLCFQGIRDMRLYPLAHICTFITVSCSVFLCGLLFMLMTTLNHELGTAQGETAFQVYWHPATDMKLIQEEWERVKHLPWYSKITTYTPREALQEMGKRLYTKGGSPEKDFPFLAAKNPLPATALITFAPHEETHIEKWLQETTAYLKNMPGVSRVLLTPLQDELSFAWRQASHYIVWPTLILFVMIMGLVVGNTVRLSLCGRAHEIEILQLVGAQNWYIRLPLLASGAITALAGAGAGLAVLELLYRGIHDLVNVAPFFISIQALSLHACLLLMLIPVLTGIVASYMAVRSIP